MLTPKEIEDRIRDRHMHQMKAAEEQIDAELEARWDERYKGILVKLNPVPHRLVLDELVKKYRGEGKYNVEYRSSKHTQDYDSLEFKPYSAPYYGGGRD